MEEAIAELPVHNVDELPLHVVELLAEYFATFHNETTDFSRPHLRHAVRHLYPLFIALYALVAVLGTVGNLLLIVTILRHRLHIDPTHFFLLNIACSDLFKCLLVMPISLTVMLLQNWVFGRNPCYVIPMMQHVPMHVTCLTFVAITVDRYRLLSVTSSRLPRLPCVALIWSVSVLVVLPFLFFITYFDLRPTIDTGLCYVNVRNNMEEYPRCLFIALYVLPLATVAYLQVRIMGEIKNRERGPLSATVTAGSGKRGGRNRDDLSFDDGSVATVTSVSGEDTLCPTRGAWRSSGGDGPPVCQTPSTAMTTAPSSPPSSVGSRKQSSKAHPLRNPSPVKENYIDDSRFQTVELNWRPLAVAATDHDAVVTDGCGDDDVLDARRDRRTQNYLVAMVMAFAVFQLPLEVLRLVRVVVFEYTDNTGVYDILFLVIVLLSYVPVCTTPLLFACWKLFKSNGKLDTGYLQFGARPVVVEVLPVQPLRNGGSGGHQRNLKLNIKPPVSY